MLHVNVLRMIVNNFEIVIDLENKGFVGYINIILNIYPRVINNLGITCGYVDFTVSTYSH